MKNNNKKSKKGLAILIICIAVILVVGFIIYMLQTSIEEVISYQIPLTSYFN